MTSSTLSNTHFTTNSYPNPGIPNPSNCNHIYLPFIYQTILQKRTSITNILLFAASELLLQVDRSTPVVWTRLAFKHRETPNGIYYNARRSLDPAASEIGDSLRAIMVSKTEELKTPLYFLCNYTRSIRVWKPIRRMASWKTSKEVYIAILTLTHYFIRLDYCRSFTLSPKP